MMSASTHTIENIKTVQAGGLEVRVIPMVRGKRDLSLSLSLCVYVNVCAPLLLT